MNSWLLVIGCVGGRSKRVHPHNFVHHRRKNCEAEPVWYKKRMAQKARHEKTNTSEAEPVLVTTIPNCAAEPVPFHENCEAEPVWYKKRMAPRSRLKKQTPLKLKQWWYKKERYGSAIGTLSTQQMSQRQLIRS